MAQGSTRAVVAAPVANAVIAVAKFVAAAVTGSSAMGVARAIDDLEADLRGAEPRLARLLIEPDARGPGSG